MGIAKKILWWQTNPGVRILHILYATCAVWWRWKSVFNCKNCGNVYIAFQ